MQAQGLTFVDAAYAWLITTGLEILVVIFIAFIAIWLVRLVLKRAFGALLKSKIDDEARKRVDTLSSVIAYALTITIWAVAAIMVLGALGIEIGPVLAAAGVLGLAIGFGAQNLVQDVISGFFILLEDQLRVGDVAQIAGKAGLVERVNLRMVVLRDLSGSVHYVRNGQIDVVTNLTKDFSYYVFDIGVAYREDVDEVIGVMKEVGTELQADPEFGPDILDELEMMGLDKFGDSAVVVKARFKTRPIKQWRVGREYNRRLKAAFDARGIEIPFPHVTVYAGADKDGSAPPLYVDLQGQEVSRL